MLKVTAGATIQFSGKVSGTVKDSSNLINDSTAFGCVFSDTTGKYAIKFVMLTGPREVETFINEAQIGMKVDPNHAVRIHGYDIIDGIDQTSKIDAFLSKHTRSSKWKSKYHYTRKHDWGIYVMNHFKEGKDEEALPLYKFMNEYEKRYQACPGPNHPVYKKLNASLKAFYRTGYYHGDLHTNNIVVIFDIKNGYDMNEVKAVKLFDYGISKPVKVNPKSCLHSMLKKVEKEFRNFKNYNGKERYNGVSLKWLPNGAGLRPNYQMLQKPGGDIVFKYLIKANSVKKTPTKRKTPAKRKTTTKKKTSGKKKNTSIINSK